MSTYYEILGVNPKASQQQIKNAYRDLIKRYHPDRNQNSPEATKQTQLINEAYEILKDPVKRFEYDNFLVLQGKQAPSEQESTTFQEKETAREVPHYHCDVCGRQDPSLRVSIFLWVVSLFYVSSKRGWGKILCSRCRIKYSLLWNLEVWVAGWWGLPFGPIYTIEALYKNSKGGIQPEENNAALLSTLAYDFYLQGRYNDAYSALQASREFKPTKESAEFVEYLRQYVTRRRAPSFLDRLRGLHPAYYNIPAFAVYLVASIFLLSSFHSNGASSSNSAYNYVPTTENPPIDSTTDPFEANSGTPEYIAAAPTFGISTDEVDDVGKQCNQEIAGLARYIASKVPYLYDSYDNGVTTHNYELDRNKLDPISVHPHTEALKLQIRQVLALRHKVEVAEYPFSELNERMKNQLLGFLYSQYLRIVASYFNSAILEYSVPIVNDWYADQQLPSSYLVKVVSLGRDRDVSTWFAKTSYSSNYSLLVDSISILIKSRRRLDDIKAKLTVLKATIDEDNSVLTEWNSRLDSYQSSGMNDEYNDLASSYNSRLAQSKRRIREYDELVKEYNGTLSLTNQLDLDGLFNDCLDPQILFAGFQRVDLHSSHRFSTSSQ